MPAAGIDLAVYNTLRVKYIEYASRQESAKQSTIQMPIYLALLFGAMSATCGAVTAYPLTLVRTRLIAQGMPGRPIKYTGPIHCIRKILAKSGPRGLYRGLIPALLKAIPAVSIGYGAFEAA